MTRKYRTSTALLLVLPLLPCAAWAGSGAQENTDLAERAGWGDEAGGACCELGGGCRDEVSEPTCWAVYAGAWHGPESVCEAIDCFGACCVAGACLGMDEAQCLRLYYGEWQGDGTDCDENLCRPEGACCFAEGYCDELVENDCEVAGGAFMGLTIPCDPLPCTEDYCAARSSQCDEYIARVQVGTLDNVSGCSRYADYSELSCDVALGGRYVVRVTNGRPFEADVCSIWIDWNDDQVFADVAPEWIGDIADAGGALPYAHSFTVLPGTALGPKQMRVRIDYDNPDPDPCGIRTYGEVEDYTLNVVPPQGACCFEYGRCEQVSEADCSAVFGVPWTDGLECQPNLCPQPELLRLLADRNCYRADDVVTIEVWMNDVTEAITGGQFFMEYDATKLAFASVEPGDAVSADPLNPFERELRATVAEGMIDYAVGVREAGGDWPDPDGDAGMAATGTRRMAVLVFRAVVDICEDPGLVSWREHVPPTRLSDTAGQPVTPELVMAVVADHLPPEIICPPEIGVECHDPRDPDHTGWASVVDNCDPAPRVEWTDSEELTGCDRTGAITRTWTAVDHCGNRSVCRQMIVVVDRTPPVLTCPDDLTLECGPDNGLAIAAWLASASATDNCGATQVSNSYAGLAEDCGGAGTATVVFTAEDECGLTDVCVRNIAVIDTTPPVLHCPAALVLECGPDPAPTIDAWLASATATDICGRAFVADNYTGLSDGCAGTGSASVTFTAMDDCGLMTVCTSTISITDSVAPAFVAPADVTRNADAGYCERLTLSAAEIGWPARLYDDCSGADGLTVEWERSDGVVPPMPLNTPFTQAVTTITWTVSDECGNTAAPQVQTVRILPYNTAEIEIEMEGELWPAALVRCMTLVFANSASGVSVERRQEMEFVRGPNGEGLGLLTLTDLPCDAYDCVSAEDDLHSLRVRLTPDVTADGAAFVATFAGAAGLRQGDLIDEYDEPTDIVDILDFGVYLHEWGQVYDTSLPPALPDGDGHTPCGLFALHADLNGDGVVDISDFAFISTNWGESGDWGCVADTIRGAVPGRRSTSALYASPSAAAPRARSLRDGGPRLSITLAELDELGLADLAVADLNEDGLLDVGDIMAFEAGARPASLPVAPDDAFPTQVLGRFHPRLKSATPAAHGRGGIEFDGPAETGRNASPAAAWPPGGVAQ